ncbi:hypothetical protein BV898_15133 [Hypsibius exemplaris]|uniref:Protein sleepless n=1 Tax=Hypsibius exemplaris TaxID=2072580 RepID=A0A9X6NAD9_HYPEX|nr:hypothetical protein BV898_15133 [Hypsibius exemplaris]
MEIKAPILFAWITIFLLTTILPDEAEAGVQCYKCDSTTDPGCQEQFDVSTSGLETVDCGEEVYQGRYCIKTTGIYGGKPGTRRFCSSKDLGNLCNYISRPNEPLDFRACIFSCTSNQCNTSQTTVAQAKMTWLILLTCYWGKLHHLVLL